MAFRGQPITTEARFRYHASPFVVGVTQGFAGRSMISETDNILICLLQTTCSPNCILVSVLSQMKTVNFVASCVFKINFVI
jgi:hypothetical protein